MLVLHNVGSKCTLAASHVSMSEGEYANGTDRQTDRQTDGRQTVTLRSAIDAASLTSVFMKCNSARSRQLFLEFCNI